MSFDPEQFMQTAVVGTLDTKYTPIPEEEYQMILGKPEPRTVKREDGSIALVVEIPCFVDPSLRIKSGDGNGKTIGEYTGMEKPSARFTLWPDLTPQGNLDLSRGKNVALGRLREAVGQNNEKEWNWSMLEGKMIRGNVKHTIRKDDGSAFANVNRVAKV
jgi:hypothetical protein